MQAFTHFLDVFDGLPCGLAIERLLNRTEAGDLLPYFRGHYDTTTGGKRESASYVKIAADMKRPASEILFISDVDAELYAAKAAGFQVALSDRPGIGFEGQAALYGVMKELV